MVALGQLLLPRVASENRAAVLVHPIGEVLARDAKTGTLPTLQLPVVNKTPFLHRRTSCLVHLYYCSGGVIGKHSAPFGNKRFEIDADLLMPTSVFHTQKPKPFDG